mmetsp:Transcript_6188/g.13679  ORF Transcript_6188/g.13679 Transcript_6188/m.13679 type:complete len:251 (+) Transcript_6188:1139-1891(+)
MPPDPWQVMKHCLDEFPACASWAKSGECKKNPQFMHSSCAQACGSCNANPDDVLPDEHLGDWKYKLGLTGQFPPHSPPQLPSPSSPPPPSLPSPSPHSPPPRHQSPGSEKWASVPSASEPLPSEPSSLDELRAPGKHASQPHHRGGWSPGSSDGGASDVLAARQPKEHEADGELEDGRRVDGNPQPIRVALHGDDLRASASCEDRAAVPNGCLEYVALGKCATDLSRSLKFCQRSCNVNPTPDIGDQISL